MRFVQERGSISNTEYRDLVGVSARTALTDLTELVTWDILAPSGGRGPNARYRLKVA